MTVPIGSVPLAVGVTAIIPAAGSGRRMGGGTPKQFQLLAGVPVLIHTLRLFAAEPQVDEIVVAAPPDWVEATWDLVREYRVEKVTRVVPGGRERQESVWRALQAVASRPRVVVIHDAARPLLSPAGLRGIVAAAARYPALTMGIPVKDTIKVAEVPAGGTAPAGGAGSAGGAGDPGGEAGGLPRVVRTLPRETLWAVQTPQVFHASLLERAHRQAMADGFVGTDDAVLVERLGEPVAIYPGEPENLKLTTPEDWALAEAILARRKVG